MGQIRPQGEHYDRVLPAKVLTLKKSSSYQLLLPPPPPPPPENPPPLKELPPPKPLPLLLADGAGVAALVRLLVMNPVLNADIWW